MIDLATLEFEEAIQTAMKLFGYDRAQAQEMVALSQGRIKTDVRQVGKKQIVWGTNLKGGRGSGNFGHGGIRGHVGGSTPGKGMQPQGEGSLENPGFLQGVTVYKAVPERVAKAIKEGGLHLGPEWFGRPPSVYFTTNKEDAQYYGHILSYKYEQYDAYAIVKFTIPKKHESQMIPDDFDRKHGFSETAFRIEKSIPPDWISSIEIYQMQDDVLLGTLKEIGPNGERYYYALVLIQSKNLATTKGGRGSGNWRHSGRPGQRGGSGAGMTLSAGKYPNPFAGGRKRPGASAPAPAPKPKPAPAPAPKMAPAPLTPSGQPKSVTDVSNHLDIHATDKNLKFDMRKVTETIDKIHGDGPLEKIPMFEKNLHGGTMGDFMSIMTTPKHIRVKTGIQDESRLAITHEIGHFIDHGGGQEYNPVPYALSAAIMSGKGRSRFPKAANPAFQQLEGAIKNSDAYKTLESIKANGVVPAKGGPKIIATPAYTDYLLDRKEVFARAYSQYIATRSGSYHMMHEVHQQQRNQKKYGDYPRYWEDQDFAPIAAGFDALFDSMGWKK